MDKLTHEVKEFARQVGADLVGIVGKECFSRLPCVRPDELLSDAQSAVVMAVRKNPLALQSGASWNSQEHYVGRLALEMHVLLRTSNFLEDKGFETVPVSHHGHFMPYGANTLEAIKHLTVTPEGGLQGVEEFTKVYWERFRVLSHKKLAEEAGLGEIGRCQMLITPRFGPRVGLVSLVTDAPLEPDSRLEEPVCQKDNKCVESCPAGAIRPDGYNLAKCMVQGGNLPPIDLIRRRDEEAIKRYIQAMRPMVFPFERGILRGDLASGQQRAGSCGMCQSACPVGRKQQAKP